jgi:hypothetical protein
MSMNCSDIGVLCAEIKKVMDSVLILLVPCGVINSFKDST